MKNLITLSAIIWLFAAAQPVHAESSYERFLQSPPYQEASTALEQLHKTEDGNFQQLVRLLGENSTFRLHAIHNLINLRCRRYLPHEERKECGLAVFRMLHNLDFDMSFLPQRPHDGKMPPFVFVAFKAELITLLKDPQTGDYLETIARQFEDQAFRPDCQFNLWSETLKFYKGNESKAVSVLAILFQDTSAARIHLEYLARHQVSNTTRFFNPNVSRLSRVIDLMVQIEHESPVLYAEIAYPEGQQNQFNNTIYHYYVPWYLAVKLRSQGTAPRFAGIAPFMLSSTYEFITSHNGYGHLLWDPATVSSEWTMRDIYAGFAGALRVHTYTRSTTSLQQGQHGFRRSSKEGMQLLLENF